MSAPDKQPPNRYENYKKRAKKQEDFTRKSTINVTISIIVALFGLVFALFVMYKDVEFQKQYNWKLIAVLSSIGFIILALMALYTPRLLKLNPKTESQTEKKEVGLRATVVGLLVDDKQKSFFTIYISLLIGFLIYLVSIYFAGQAISIGTLSLLAAFLLALFLNQYLLKYRLKYGYFGTTEHEAREIIDLILKHSDKSDFSDGDGLNELFPEPERGGTGHRVLVPSLDNDR
ncbi:MAG: hypothetical protein V7641_843 [Blastocatellia bacterium]